MPKLDTNHILYFHYPNPVTKKLPVWDLFPLVIILDNSHPRTLLALNLHWVPPLARKRIVEFIIDHSKRLPKRKLARLVYQMLLADPRLRNSAQGVRRYIKSRIRMLHKIDKTELDRFDTHTKVSMSLFQKYQRKFTGPKSGDYKGKITVKKKKSYK